MGFLISLSSLLTVGASYVVRIYVSNKGGLEQVGLYNAGFAIINTYFGLILTAMATDYYPRLAAVSNDIKEYNKLINQQAEIAILIISPILLIFIIFIKSIIFLLYSNQFLPAYNMIIWASIGMFFKTPTWAIGFLLLAKSSNKIYFFSELLSNFILLTLNILGYKYLGLKGLGISFLLSYIISFIQLFFITKKYYKFSFEYDFLKIFIVHFLLAIICLLILNFTFGYLYYILGLSLIISSIIYSIYHLNKRINIFSIFKKNQNTQTLYDK
jgi:O-antigen/teichoic acid export membrane protein